MVSCSKPLRPANQEVMVVPIPITDLARAYDALYPYSAEKWLSPPTAGSVRRINETLSIRLPDSLLAFVTQCGACHRWLASLGEDFESDRHILKVAARTRRIRRRIIGGKGRWEYVRPPLFVPFTHGYDDDYNCLDGAAFDAGTGEYTIQYWAPPRILGDTRYRSFPEYMESCIRWWATHAKKPQREAVLSILGPG